MNKAMNARRRTAMTMAIVLAVTGLAASGAAGRHAEPTAARFRTTTATPATLEEAVAHGMPTEEEAQAAGGSVEVTGLRQERRTVVANSDGSFTAEEFAEPVRTLKSGTWNDIDDTLVQRADGSWAPKATPADVTFSDGGDGRFARIRVAGRELALIWPDGTLPKPVVDGDSATYRNVLPDVDLVVHAEPDGLGHLVIVRTPEAAKNPDLARLDLGVDTTSLTLEETASGALRALDSQSKGVVLEAGSPMMWDAGDEGDSSGTAAHTASLTTATAKASSRRRTLPPPPLTWR